MKRHRQRKREWEEFNLKKCLSWQQKNKNDSSLGLDEASRSYADSLNEHEHPKYVQKEHKVVYF